MDSSKNRSNKSLYYEQLAVTHHAWRPVNLNVRDHRQFHIPRVLFTHLMKNLGVPEIFAKEFLHICQNFRGICKSIKNDIFGLENNLYLHYSHKGVIVRVTETISKLQNWHTCKNFRGTLPCNLSKCAVFHTWSYNKTPLKMIHCVNNEDENQLQDQMLHFRMFAKLPLQFLHDFCAKR